MSTNSEWYTWFVSILLLIGLISALVAFFKTPKGKRYSASRTLEEQLSEYTVEYDAKIIKGDKKRYILKNAKTGIPTALLFILIYILSELVGKECEELFNVSVIIYLGVTLLYLLPIWFFILSLTQIKPAIKVLKHGHCPPLDTITFNDTIAVKGKKSFYTAIYMLVIPFVILVVLFYIHYSINQTFEGKGITDINSEFLKKCK